MLTQCKSDSLAVAFFSQWVFMGYVVFNYYFWTSETSGNWL